MLSALILAGAAFVATGDGERIVRADLATDEPPYSVPVDWIRRPELRGPALQRLAGEGRWAVVECFAIRRSGRLGDCRSRRWDGADAVGDRMAVAAVRRGSVRLPARLVENKALLRSAAIVVTIRFDGSHTRPAPGPGCPPTICYIHHYGPPPPPPPHPPASERPSR